MRKEKEVKGLNEVKEDAWTASRRFIRDAKAASRRFVRDAEFAFR